MKAPIKLNLKTKFIIIITLITIISIAIIISLCKYEPVKNEGRLSFYRNNKIIKTIYIQSIETTEWIAEQKLMYDNIMSEPCGMLFIFKDESILPFRMSKNHQSFDILFIAPNNRIVIMEKNISPNQEKAPSFETDILYNNIVILNAGFCNTYSIFPDDSVSFRLHK